VTAPAPRIRWEPGEDGILFGYSGTLKPWVFAVCPPRSPGDFWMISTPFPLGQPRYVGSEKEARKAAERWLAEFIAALGVSFPAEPGDPFADIPGAGHDLDDFAEGRRVCYAYPGNGYLSGRVEAAELLTEGEVYTVTQRMVGTSVTYLELQGVEGHFNSVMFEPVPLEENRGEEEEPEP
jgi:hypothetical protein